VVAAAFATATAMLGRAAPAQDAGSTPHTSRADALYDEGTRLLDAGDFERACPMLAESHKVDPAPGALLAVARCHEKAGKLATAWSTYGEAATLARMKGDAAREAAARKQADLLIPRLPRLVVRLDPAWPAARTTVTRNGAPIAQSELGSPLIVDPGVLILEVEAADGRNARQELTIVEAQTFDIVVPAPGLLVEPGASAPPPVSPPPEEGPTSGGLSGVGVTGLILGGLGLAGLGVGGIFGLVASGQNGEAEEVCAPYVEGSGGTLAGHAQCTEALADARGSADLASVFLIAGGVLAAGGLTLLLVDVAGDDGAPSTAMRVGAWGTPLGGGAAARGTF
jgi:hypothetical protein